METKMLKVFNPEFVAVVLARLEKLEDDDCITRENLCKKIGISKEYANAISMILVGEEFKNFESVRSRGIRRKKDAAPSTPTVATVITASPAPAPQAPAEVVPEVVEATAEDFEVEATETLDEAVTEAA